MTRIATLTSSCVTLSRRCMRACASLIRIMLSRWRTAMGRPPLRYDSLRSRAYTCCRLPNSLCMHTKQLTVVVGVVGGQHTGGC
jgi:hypothetical protein